MGQHLTVYHIKDNFAKLVTDSYDPLINKSKRYTVYYPIEGLEFEARLFRENIPTKTPPWEQFLKQGFNNLPEFKTKSENSVLFIKVPYKNKKEVFAFTFGMGRYLLNSRCYEKAYGLHVALNAIYEQTDNPNRIKSVATKNIGLNPMRTTRQRDRHTPFEDFEVDPNADILTRITGLPVKTDYWSTQMTGADSLTATLNILFKQLGQYCTDILDNRSKTNYKTDFEWIDFNEMVIETDVFDELSECVVPTIKNKPGNLILTLPEQVNWENVNSCDLQYKNQKQAFDLNVDDINEALIDLQVFEDLDIDMMMNDLFLVVNDANGKHTPYHFWDCLSGEIEQNKYPGNQFIMSEGEFFKYSKDYVEKLHKYLNDIPASTYEFPSSVFVQKKDKMGPEDEQVYSERVAEADKDLLLLDRKTVKIGGRTSKIEICDLLLEGKCFIHVKPHLHSSTLSHLFSQGSVSANLLQSNQEFREKTLKIIKREAEDKDPDAGKPYVNKFCTFTKDKLNPADYEVTYAMIADWDLTKKDFAETLPFFSRVNLRKHVDDIRRRGYKVSRACISYEHN